VEVNTITSEMKEDNSITCADEGRIELDDKEKNIMPKTLSLKKCHDEWKRGRRSTSATKDKKRL